MLLFGLAYRSRIINMVSPEIIFASITLLLLSLLLVLTVLRWRLRGPLVFPLAIYTSLSLLVNLFILLALSDMTTTHLNYPLTIEFNLLALILSFGALTLTFLRKTKRGLWSYWGITLILLALWSGFTINFQGRTDQVMTLLSNSVLNLNTVGELTRLVAGLGWAISLITVVVGLLSERRKHHPTQFLNRLRYWLIVTILLTATGLSFYFNPLEIFSLTGLALMTTATVLAVYTILSYHTPDLKFLIGRGLHYVGMTLILAGVTLLGLMAAIQLFLYIPGQATLWIWLTVLAVGLGNLYGPLTRWTNRFLTRLIWGKRQQNERQMIRRYHQHLSNSFDPQNLGNATAKVMLETLNTPRSVVFINERVEGEVSLWPVSTMGIKEVVPRRFTHESPFVRYLQDKRQILSQYDIDVRPEFKPMTREEKQWLSGLGIELYVPVSREQELLGVLAFGPQPQGTAYSQEEKELMETLADQAGLALEGARLFQQLALINEEVGLLTQRLSLLDQSKSDFLSIASHELRTPLTQIHTYSQLLLELTEEDLKDQAYIRRVFQGLAQGSERMKDIVDLMLDVSAADLGKMSLFRGPVRLKEVYEQAIHPFLPALEERQLQVAETGLNELPMVDADGTRLVQVLENLIGNAIKYTPDGGQITVRGRCLETPSRQPMVEIVVADSGIGIEPEHHRTIFEKFFRIGDSLHHTTSKTRFKGGGPGLGLTLAKAIVEAHRGQIWVESPGCDEKKLPGSSFFFTLPVPLVSE